MRKVIIFIFDHFFSLIILENKIGEKPIKKMF